MENTLYVMDMDVEISDLIKENQNINPETIIVLQNGPISSPFDDLMRSIIIAVYQYNIEEIVIVSSPNENRQKSLWNRLGEEFQEEFQEKVQTLNYFFQNCKPELHGNCLRKWFEGRETSAAGARNIASVISHHPLLPPDIKIREISIVEESRDLQVIG